jgi:transcription elongation factor Elf1
MGCYDSVMVPCPRCGRKAEFQSKSGECALAIYQLGEAPPEVMDDINRHAPHTCSGCGALFKVNITVIGTPVLVEPDVGEKENDANTSP